MRYFSEKTARIENAYLTHKRITMKVNARFDKLLSSESIQDLQTEDASTDGSIPENLETDEIDSTSHLKRSLSFFDGLGIIVGIIIGSGIFSSPGLALQRSGSPGACLLAWSVSGMLVCLTSQCYFELGSMMPTAGEHRFLND